MNLRFQHFKNKVVFCSYYFKIRRQIVKSQANYCLQVEKRRFLFIISVANMGAQRKPIYLPFRFVKLCKWEVFQMTIIRNDTLILGTTHEETHIFKDFWTLLNRPFWYCTLTLQPRSILCDDTIPLDHYAVCTSTRQLVWQETPSRRHIQNLLPYGWPHLERL